MSEAMQSDLLLKIPNLEKQIFKFELKVWQVELHHWRWKMNQIHICSDLAAKLSVPNRRSEQKPNDEIIKENHVV